MGRRSGFDTQRAFAAALLGATEDVKWGTDLVVSVGGRMFCVFLLQDGHTASCSFKVDDDRFLELTGVAGVVPAPYLAHAKWVQVSPGHGLGAGALEALIRRSHALVSARLTKKLRKEIGVAV